MKDGWQSFNRIVYLTSPVAVTGRANDPRGKETIRNTLLGSIAIRSFTVGDKSQ